MVDSDRLAQRRSGVTEQGIRDSRTEHHHSGSGADLGSVEKRSHLKIAVVHLEPPFRGTDDTQPKLGARGRGQSLAGGSWDDGGDVGCLPLQRRDISVDQILRGSAAGDLASRWHDRDQISQRLDFRIDGGLHPVTDCDQQDHRRDADDDAEHS